MLILIFNKSRSIKLSHVLKWFALFSGYEDNIDSVALPLPVKEVFERWDDFNSIFWTVVDWKGAYFSFENMDYHSHLDKTRIFYALQNSHWKWMNYIETKIALLYKTTKEELSIEKLNTSKIDDKMADLLIDLYSIKKQ